MASNHCFKCQGVAPPSSRKKGWHSITSDAGIVKCYPACGASMGLPGPTQLPERPRKDVLTRKMTKRTLLNLLVKQGYLKLGELTLAEKSTRKVIIDGVYYAIVRGGTIPYHLGECAVVDFDEITADDKAGPVYYHPNLTQISWFIWATKGREQLTEKVRVKLLRNGQVVLE